METKTISACPECGNPTNFTCYHDGEYIPPINISLEKAIEINNNEIRFTLWKLKQLGNIKDRLMRLS